MNFENIKDLVVVHKTDIGLLLLRLVLSFIFIAHGAMNLTVDFEETNSIMMSLGFPDDMAYLIGISEILSSVMMLSGFLVGLSAWIQVVIDAGLVFLVDGKNGFDVHDGGYEYSLLLLVCAFVVILLGPGKFVLEKRWGHQARNLREVGVESEGSTLAT
jgi:putative oxidoreductase